MRYHVDQKFDEYGFIQRDIIVIFGGKFFEVVHIAAERKRGMSIVEVIEEAVNFFFFSFLSVKRRKHTNDDKSIYAFSDVDDVGFRMFYLEKGIIKPFDDLIIFDDLDQKRQKLGQFYISRMVSLDLLPDLFGFLLIILNAFHRFLSHFA